MHFLPCRMQISSLLISHVTFKVVPEGYHRYFFEVKVKTVNLIHYRTTCYQFVPHLVAVESSFVYENTRIGGRRFLAVGSGLYMPVQIIQMMAFTQIMAIWTSWITLQDHLKSKFIQQWKLRVGSKFRSPSYCGDLNFDPTLNFHCYIAI